MACSLACRVAAARAKKVSPATVRYVRALVSAALADGVRESLLGRNIVARRPAPHLRGLHTNRLSG